MLLIIQLLSGRASSITKRRRLSKRRGRSSRNMKRIQRLHGPRPECICSTWHLSREAACCHSTERRWIWINEYFISSHLKCFHCWCSCCPPHCSCCTLFPRSLVESRWMALWYPLLPLHLLKSGKIQLLMRATPLCVEKKVRACSHISFAFLNVFLPPFSFSFFRAHFSFLFAKSVTQTNPRWPVGRPNSFSFARSFHFWSASTRSHSTRFLSLSAALRRIVRFGSSSIYSSWARSLNQFYCVTRGVPFLTKKWNERKENQTDNGNSILRTRGMTIREVKKGPWIGKKSQRQRIESFFPPTSLLWTVNWLRRRRRTIDGARSEPVSAGKIYGIVELRHSPLWQGAGLGRLTHQS